MNPLTKDIRHFIDDNFLFGQGAGSGAGRDDQIADGDSFLERGIIDSTGVLELVSFLEEKYPIRIADEELVPENLDSISNLVRFIEKKLGEAQDCV